MDEQVCFDSVRTASQAFERRAVIDVGTNSMKLRIGRRPPSTDATRFHTGLARLQKVQPAPEGRADGASGTDLAALLAGASADSRIGAPESGVILAGAVIHKAVLNLFGFEEILISSRGPREGFLMISLTKGKPATGFITDPATGQPNLPLSQVR